MKRKKLIPKSFPRDYLEIEVQRKFIYFHIGCDSAGFTVRMRIKDFLEMLE